MASKTNMSKAKALINRALSNSGKEKRYNLRMESNPILAKLGCLPKTLSEISNDQSPWFCHGLAFRMATYSADVLFDRLETLISLAKGAKGWQEEYEHWNNASDHWAKKWDKLHQFLWLLQCFEYFSESDYDVSFPATTREAMPDLLIERRGEQPTYVECFFYTKWWHHELFLEELLRSLDSKLTISRTHNIAYDHSSNPMSVDDSSQFVDALANLEKVLTPSGPAEKRAEAEKVSPQLVCKIGDFSILLEGEGTYQPSQNAQGDPTKSFQVYVNEIIKTKKNSNGLKNRRPNLVMVNGLGLDFQLSFGEGSPTSELPCSLDEIRVYRCGIDAKLGEAPDPWSIGL